MLARRRWWVPTCNNTRIHETADWKRGNPDSRLPQTGCGGDYHWYERLCHNVVNGLIHVFVGVPAQGASGTAQGEWKSRGRLNQKSRTCHSVAARGVYMTYFSSEPLESYGKRAYIINKL
jgi:hypothetical protein